MEQCKQEMRVGWGVTKRREESIRGQKSRSLDQILFNLLASFNSNHTILVDYIPL